MVVAPTCLNILLIVASFGVSGCGMCLSDNEFTLAASSGVLK